MPDWDYIIAGGGTAGCILAARLSEDSDVKVLLIEAGGKAFSPFIQIPNGIYFLKGNPHYHWLIETEADPSRNNRRETLTCGKVLGGGSSINGMVYVETLAADLALWEAAGGSDWQTEKLASYARKARTTLNIRQPSDMHPVSNIFLESAVAAGIPLETLAFPHPSFGAMPCPSSASGGWRQSTDRTYLSPARTRKNLTILTNTEVHRVIIDNNRATGVVINKNGREKHIHASREVILSTGAINTPKILMLSGIGPAHSLQQAGVNIHLDQPEVGQNLQDHPCIWISATVKTKTWTDVLGWRGMASAGLEWLLKRSGPAGSGMCQATLFTGNSPEGGAACQMSFMPAGYKVQDQGVSFLSDSSVTTAVSLCQPQGRGSIRLVNADPGTQPEVTYRLLDRTEDIKALTEGGRLARAIYNQHPFANIITGEVAPGPDVNSDAEWVQFLRKAAVNMCHPAGSCRMGKDSLAVVDPKLRVNGISALRIADASIMPVISSGNTNAPTAMIAEKAAALIREDDC